MFLFFMILRTVFDELQCRIYSPVKGIDPGILLGLCTAAIQHRAPRRVHVRKAPRRVVGPSTEHAVHAGQIVPHEECIEPERNAPCQAIAAPPCELAKGTERRTHLCDCISPARDMLGVVGARTAQIGAPEFLDFDNDDAGPDDVEAVPEPIVLARFRSNVRRAKKVS